MELYFAEGGDLSDPKVLIQTAIGCGMDSVLVRRLLASDADVDRIENGAEAPRARHRRRAVKYVFSGGVIVTGAQSPEYLASAIGSVAGPARVRA